MNVMCFGAHPDDIEVGCASTLLKHRSVGDIVHVVITTWGGYGTRSESMIREEMEMAQQVLGLKYIALDNPIGHYSMNWKTVRELDELLTDKDIDTVYCTWYGDSHQDHVMTYRNVLAACRAKRIRSLYLYELASYSQRSGELFQPKRYVDITNFLETKLSAIKCYKSYPRFNDQFIEVVKGLARFRGEACGVDYAEAFEVVFETW